MFRNSIQVSAAAVAFAVIASSCAHTQETDQTFSVEDRTKQKNTEIGTIFKAFEIHDGQYLSAHCFISRGALKEDASGLGDTISKAAKVLSLDKGDAQCAGKVSSEANGEIYTGGEKAKAKLSLNFKRWKNGDVQTHDEHDCVITKHKCFHQNRKDDAGIDALSVCLNVLDRRSDENASVTFVIENKDDDTDAKVPDDVKADLGYKAVSCSQRTY